jgi:hypothetical protein
MLRGVWSDACVVCVVWVECRSLEDVRDREIEVEVDVEVEVEVVGYERGGY